MAICDRLAVVNHSSAKPCNRADIARYVAGDSLCGRTLVEAAQATSDQIVGLGFPTLRLEFAPLSRDVLPSALRTCSH